MCSKFFFVFFIFTSFFFVGCIERDLKNYKKFTDTATYTDVLKSLLNEKYDYTTVYAGPFTATLKGKPINLVFNSINDKCVIIYKEINAKKEDLVKIENVSCDYVYKVKTKLPEPEFQGYKNISEESKSLLVELSNYKFELNKKFKLLTSLAENKYEDIIWHQDFSFSITDNFKKFKFNAYVVASGFGGSISTSPSDIHVLQMLEKINDNEVRILLTLNRPQFYQEKGNKLEIAVLQSELANAKKLDEILDLENGGTCNFCKYKKEILNHGRDLVNFRTMEIIYNKNEPELLKLKLHFIDDNRSSVTVKYYRK